MGAFDQPASAMNPIEQRIADSFQKQGLMTCIDPLNSCTGVIVEGNDDEYPDGRRYQALDGQA